MRIPNTTRIELFPLHLLYNTFFRTHTHTHTQTTTNTQMKQRTPSYVNYLRLHENQLAPTFSGPYRCRLNSFVLILLSSLKSFGFNTNDVSFGKRSLVCIFICVLPLLRPQFFRQRHIRESNTELFSLFTSQKKPYMYYMLVCVLLLFTFSVKKNSCIVILRRERAFSLSNVHIIYNMEQKVFGSVCIKGNSNIYEN